MKKFFILCFILKSVIVFSQTTPPGIPYQAIARNANGTPYTNASLSVRFSLHEQTATGTVSYAETKSLQTNDLGLFSTTFGSGTPIAGTFAGINWAQTTKFLQVEINLGSAWVDMGTQQLMSVPYAMFAGASLSAEFTNDQNHGLLTITSDTMIVINSNIKLMRFDIFGAKGGKGANANINYGFCLGSNGGAGRSVSLYLTPSYGDSIFIKIGQNGQDGYNIPFPCSGQYGTAGTTGTSTAISINDPSFNNFLIKCEPGTGGSGTFGSNNPYCSCGSYNNPGVNGYLIEGTQYNNYGAFIIAETEYSGQPKCRIKW